ncbi:MAG: TldD/PmbA family protein [Gemmatimonadaceae bacterium]
MKPQSLMADADFLSREQAKALCDRVLSFAKADSTRVNVNSGWQGNSRFAGNEITTSGGSTNTTVNVTSTIGRRRASASTNILDDEGLKKAVALSESLAKLSPEDPEIMPDLEPQTYATVNSYFDSTAQLTPEVRATAVQKNIATAEDEGKSVGKIFVAGFLDATAGANAVANSKGLFAYHRSTSVSLSTTARTPDATGSGWSSAGARDWSLIDPVQLGKVAAQKAVASRTPKAVEPGLWTVVLEPAAVAEIMPSLMGAFNARNNDEGRGTFSNATGGGTKLGQKIADERVTLYSDPTDPDLLGQPFDAEGLPLRRVTFIENGILKQFSYDRFWAQKQGKQATNSGGGGRGGGGGGGGGGGAGVKFVGGTKSTAELIAGCERGILVTHFFYIRSLDQKTVLLTGLTRDGTFLIEKGKITQPVKNFRWNESPLFMLSKIEEVGKAERTAAGAVWPALRVKDFNFSSLSDAV